MLFRKNTTGKWKYLRETMPGVYNGASGVVTGLDAEAGTITVRLAGEGDEARRWDQARSAQEAEIDALREELGAWGDRRQASDDRDERATATRRYNDTKAKLHRRMVDREAGLVTLDGARSPDRSRRSPSTPSTWLPATSPTATHARSTRPRAPPPMWSWSTAMPGAARRHT